jgi:cytochrome c-type biogenesis protein CcmF
MFVWRWRDIPSFEGDEPFLSKTVFVVIGILMLILIGLVVAFGTSAPLITRLWMESPAQVGPDFYNRLGIWLAIGLAVVLGTTPFLGWARARKRALARFATVVAATAVLMGVAAVLGVRDWRSVAYVAAVLYCTIANLWALVEKVAGGSLRRAGGEVAHVGMALMMLAFITTGWYGEATKVRIVQGEATEVLGYSMRFRGVEKPTPMSRDAMVLDVETSSGATFAMKPRMWVNEKSNQLVANPDIRSFPSGDLYIAPVEYSPGEPPSASGRLVLAKGETHAFRDWQITFEGFDMSSEHASAQEMAVGIVLSFMHPGQDPVTVVPTVISSGGGLRPVAAEIPGTDGAQVRAVGMAVDAGQVNIELSGLGGGVGAERVLAKGEQLRYGDLTVTFDDFDLSDFDPEVGKIDFGVVYTVTRQGETSEVVARVAQTENGMAVTPAVVPGPGGMTLGVGRVSAEDGTVETVLNDPAAEGTPARPASLVIDVSTKPLIGLVWVGTLLVIAGIIMAMIVRRKEVAAA